MKNETYTVSANDIEIWAAIGVHPEEALVENCFRVSVSIAAKGAYTGQSYMDYELISVKVKAVFQQPHKVLEDICSQIIDELKEAIPHPLSSIRCEIKKMSLALDGMRLGSYSAGIERFY